MKRMLKVLLLGCLGLGIFGGGLAAWILWGDNTRTYADDRGVHLPVGTRLSDAADSLMTRGILDRRWSFVLLAEATGWGDQIKAGHYTFTAPQSNKAILDKLRFGQQTSVRIMIPAGSRPERIAGLAARNMAFSAEEFLAALKDAELATSLGTDTLHLFTYMLPDTYYEFWLTDAPGVVRRIKREFDRYFARELADSAAALDLTLPEVVSLAAIVEWETNVNQEKSTIAGVYLNRLHRQWPLQADPTVQYALIELEGGKRRLLFRDYRIDHSYNTYRFRGLPPGPITNPSRSSLESTVRAGRHDYMFFVAKPGGGHAFNVTLSGHNRDAAVLRRYLRERRRIEAAAQ
ncbi:MAG: endolytic transglycosylase MltG [Bacteroidota bacterium]|nr:endolytic transglycosylase MltG [Bacteroidota bacterium]